MGTTVNYAGQVREPVRVTRPGTPMTGPYSVNQMDDFYAALAAGQVKPTGIMNYIQRLFIAERCGPGARVIDVCCGRGLQLPVLYRYAPHIACYLGLDITQAHLDEARARAAELDDAHGARPFEISLAQCDVAGAWPPCLPADVIIYTSALEHLPRDAGAASLRHAAGHSPTEGRCTFPRRTPPAIRRACSSMACTSMSGKTANCGAVLAGTGLTVTDAIGLLPPLPQTTVQILARQYGPGAADWYTRLAQTIPEPFLATVSAAALGPAAAEIMYVCQRQR